MDIPFALRFLKKVELFQVLRKLDSQFKVQLKKGDGINPLWEAEKKILFWAYTKHKHLGSPLTVKELRSKKSVALKCLRKYGGAHEHKEKIEQIKSVDTNEFETNFRTYFDGWNEAFISEFTDIPSRRKEEVGLSPEETDKTGVREIFGNLVSRGYAKYYPEIQEEVDHWETDISYSGPSTLQREVYKTVPVTQVNCDGIYINAEGMLMGELIHNLFTLEEIANKKPSSSITNLYKNRTGTAHFLYKKRLHWFFYASLTWISYIALFLIICFILKELLNLLIFINEKIGQTGIWSYLGMKIHSLIFSK